MSKSTKKDLIAHVTTHTTLTRAQSTRAVTALLDSMQTSLLDGHSVGLSGIGVLFIRPTMARTGVRPGTGETITIPAGRKVAFRVAHSLKQTLA